MIKMNNQHTKLGPGMPVSPLPSSHLRHHPSLHRYRLLLSRAYRYRLALAMSYRYR